jgi:16S rRNA (uracil1498-N3)-methyltransferase
MKSLYLPDTIFSVGQVLGVSDDDYHHLVRVFRIQSGEYILLLNGRGSSAKAHVNTIKKDILELTVEFVHEQSYANNFIAVILSPKKDALDLTIRSCVELCFRKIILVRGQHSSEKLPLFDKINKQLKQAIEQSNASFIPELQVDDLVNIDFKSFPKTIVLDNHQAKAKMDFSLNGDEALVVGPEGGFSSQEREFLASIESSFVLHLPTAILRAPTALVAGAGWLYAHLSVR